MSTIKCSNCGKDIESFKMILHERLCSLNVRKCSICEEPIQIDEYDEHKNIIHPDIKCEFCGKVFGNKEYNSHLKECSKKLEACRYCELYMNKSEIKEHEYQCGSKTTNCEYCKEMVTKADYDLHLQFTCKVKLKIISNDDTYKNNENKRNNNINQEDSIKNEKKDLYNINKINEIISKKINNNNNIN